MKKVSEIKKEWLRENIKILSKKGKHKVDISRDLDIKPQYLNSLTNSSRGISDQFIDKFISTYQLIQYDLFKYEKTEFQVNESIIDNYKNCPHCVEKDKIIKKLEHEITELQEDKNYYKKCIDRLDGDIKKTASG